MSELIFSKETDCRYCYKCLRKCPVKAISFQHGKSKVLDEECIHCGTCLKTCPQNARSYRKDVGKFLNLGKPFLVSIAPSFFAYFKEPLKVVGALKKMGALVVQETAVGAEIVSRKYKKLFETAERPFITTACPVVVNLVEKHFPTLRDRLFPFDSPMVAHAKFMKKRYGDFPVVFVGPCIAKKEEGKAHVDVVLTFEELEEILPDLNTAQETLPDGPYPNRARSYPSTGGVGITSGVSWEESVVIEGVENLMRFFEQMEKIEGRLFVEASACVGGCLGSPIMSNHVLGKERLKSWMRKLPTQPCLREHDLEITRTFSDRSKKVQIAEEEVQKILASIGKDDPSKELNCEACGYETCREKAKAVVLGKAEREMCFTYLLDLVRSSSYRVVEESPNAVFVKKEGKTIYKNKVATELLEKHGEDIFQKVEENLGQTLTLDDGERSFFIVKKFHLPDGEEVLMLIDITREKMREEELNRLKLETLKKFEEMLRKQMRIAQEIAGILGESIAETKSSFFELKRSLEGENDYL